MKMEKAIKGEKKVNNKKSKIGTIIAVVVFILLVVAFVLLIVMNNDNKVSKEEKEKVESFSSAMVDTYETARTMDYDDAKKYIMNQTYDNVELYGGYDGVDYTANYILSTLATDASATVDELISNLKTTTNDAVDDVLNGDLLSQSDNNISRKSLTMKSNTVCTDGDIDQKYCVENLNARIYITDENSDKWAVLLHGYMMSGSLMYMAVGDMYTSQGYNVIAPDSRGFGASDGSVAMGYLESLDVYDWIKDVNENWSRYGVKKAPETIVVHGISLGGATTLQLATNPDIASASGAPYTKNLTSLHVKGFVDDCGYTSMTGIITEPLSIGDMSQLTSMLGSLNIDEATFMAEFSKLTSSLNIQGFDSFNFDASQLEVLDTTEIMGYLEQFASKFEEVEKQFSAYENSNGTYQIPGYDKSVLDDLISKYGNTDYSSYLPDGIYPRDNSEGSEVLDNLVAQVLMNLVGLGLTDENYDKYSDVFSAGRSFPAGAKVMIIHGTADTTVPYSNAGVVEKNVSPATLVHKWDVNGAPHAFIVVGMNKQDYKSLITNFTKCVPNENCVTVNK